MKEVWGPVNDNPEYIVSNLGGVRSFKWGRTSEISGTTETTGYTQVWLSNKLTKKSGVRMLHHLVMEAFGSRKPIGHQCNHKDGNKTNNHIDNLEWVTPSENTIHALKNRLIRGRLSPARVRLIRRWLGFGGVRQKEIGAVLGIRQQTISKVNTGTRWGWL